MPTVLVAVHTLAAPVMVTPAADPLIVTTIQLVDNVSLPVNHKVITFPDLA